MTTITQRTFSSGEISPALYARVDLTKYATGLRTCRNSVVLRYGGVANRSGSVFVGEVSDSSKTVKLIEFVFSVSQTYVLEFGDQYMRVIKNGAHITEAAKAITSITKANPAVVAIAAHGYANGDEVYINGVLGMTQVNNRNFKVANVTAGTFELQEMDGTNLDSTAFTTYTSGGSSYKIYEISTDYLEAELSSIQYVQSADIITIVHPNHKPVELSRMADDNWTIGTIEFAPDAATPTAVNATPGAAGANTYRYKVTAIDEETGEESLAGTGGATINITGITNADPAVVTSGVHGLVTDDEVFIEGVAGMLDVNGQNYYVGATTATTFELYGVDSTDFDTYSSGGTAKRIYTEIISAAVPTTGAPHVITWTKAAGAKEYNIYKETNGIYGQIGVATGATFDDINITPNTTYTPPTSRNPFVGTGNYPSTVTYIQQRLALAAPDNDPEKIYLSRAGNFKNFTTSKPLQDDDAITFTMAGRQINEVKSMIDLGRLVIMTSGGEWSAAGDQAGIISPTTVNTKQYSYNGSGTLPPIIIDGAAIYQQARGSIIRDLGFDFQVDGYTGNDLTIFSSHLFDNYTLVDWAYQQIPHSVLWAVRSDGVLLGMTFVRKQEVMAWHRHDFDGGLVENVAVIPDGNEDSLYVTVKRTIDGKTKRYIEKIDTRQINDIEDVKMMDSNLTYDGRNTNGSHTMTLSGGSTWEYTESLTLTSSASYFTALDIGNSINVTGSDGSVIRCAIIAYTSGTVVTIKPHATVPVALRATATATWTRAVDQVTGLWHLEGKNVSIFGDGFVVASPNNPSYDLITVINGTVTLDKTYGVIHIGLPYISDIETLDIDSPSGETLSDKKKIVGTVNMFVEESRGIWTGAKAPLSTESAIEGLTEAKLRSNEAYDEPTALKTDTISVNIRPEWNSNGRVFIRQIDPVPLTLLSVSPAGNFPFRGQ